MTIEDIDQVSQLEAKTFSMPWSRDAFAGMADNPSALFLLAMDGHYCSLFLELLRGMSTE